MARTTRSSARQQNTNTSTANDADQHPPHIPSQGSQPLPRAPGTRKRKAPEPTPTTTPKETRRSKRQRGNTQDAEEQPEADPIPEPAKGGKRKTPGVAQNMSDRPSSGTSGETSPQQVPKDAGRKKVGSRKKSKEGEPSVGSSSTATRKSKRPSKKDGDIFMKDADEKAEEDNEGEEAETTKAGAGDDGKGARAAWREELDELERSGGDPFGSSYLSRLAGHSGLSSSLRALSGIMSGTHSRLRNILEQLRVKEDPSIQLIALQDLSELLLVSNEDNLAGHFSPDQYVKELVTLMQPNDFTGEENPEIMLLACRCIANLMEALPAATASVVYGGAVPILCQKLLEIHFIDLAEQALSTLEKISIEFPSSIVREGGLTACLTYLDFFATSTQRTAVTTAANCCRNIPEESFPTVRDVMPILLNTLQSSDQKVVEQASLCVSRVVDSFKYNEEKLEELVSADLLRAIQRLLLPGSTNLIGPNIHTQFIRVLGITARASPQLSVDLLKMGVVDTLYQILTGVSPPSGTEDVVSKIDKNVIMQAIIRTPREQIFEALNVICELLPQVSRDGLTFLDDLVDAGNQGGGNVSLSFKSRAKDGRNSNEKRVALLQDCQIEVRRYAIVLFPTLMHAYTSTVNLSVRQKVLTAQLKMLSNFDTAILEEALRGVTYASHLASILTQQENPTLVTFALQAAELLLKRLESIYRPQFYREGVIAEITKLANRALKSDDRDKRLLSTVGEALPITAHPIESIGDDIDHELHQDEEHDDEEPEHIEIDVVGEEDSLHSNEHDENEGNNNGDTHEESDHDDEEEEDGENGEGEPSEPSASDSDEPSLGQQRVMNVQDTITIRAQKFVEAHGDEGSDAMRAQAAAVLDDLRNLGGQLQAMYSGTKSDEGGTELFKRLAKYFDGDALESITSYELMTSGILDALLKIFNDDDDVAATAARSDFLEVFMAPSTSSKVATGTADSPTTAFSVFVHKLQDLLSRTEHFEVLTVHQNAFDSNRNSAASMLAKQLRLKLVADDQSGIPRQYRNIMVSIHAIATFKALDDFLRPRISLAERPPSDSRRKREELMQRYAAAMAAGGAGLPIPPGLPRIGDMPTRGVATPPSATRKPPRTNSAQSEPPPPADPSTNEGATSRLRRSSRRHTTQAALDGHDLIPPAPPSEAPSGLQRQDSQEQEPIECADEAQLSEDGNEDAEAELDALVNDLEDGALESEKPEPSAINMEVGQSGKVTARTEEGARVYTPLGSQGPPTPTASSRERSSLASASARLAAAREMLSTPTSSTRPMSYASALQQVPQDWHIEFSVNDQAIANETTVYRVCHFNQAHSDEVSSRNVWSGTHTIKFKKVPGPPPAETTALSPPMEDRSTAHNLPASLDQHPVTSGILRLMSILHDLNANLDEVISENKRTVELSPEPLTQFVNTKLTAKLNRQLDEPLIVASCCLPTWAEDLARHFPFLFPFETRHLFLSSTSFGYSRSMARWQNGQDQSDTRRRHDDRQFLGKVQRQKVRISRSRILESAIKVMELYGSSASVLEVEYFEEVGTGLGPTLEFYSTVSKEFSKKKTKLWRENEAFNSDDYAFGKHGLFPAPMSEKMAGDENGQRVLHLFKMLGKFVARSMLDSRIIDVSLNPTFFRVGEGNSSATPSLGAVAAVDQDLAKQLKWLKKYAGAKQRIEDDSSLSPAQKHLKIKQIRINDATIEELGLDFTLPGYPHIELVPDGSQKSVTLDNVNMYVDKVLDMTLRSGVQRQADAFRAGFSQVFPYSALKAFTPDELVMLFGRVEEDWSLETLMDSIKADHGFNLDSKSVRNLLQTMSELTPQAKRDFLQFVTGSPKLPIGGFKALTPMFTVVCKPSEPPYTSDDYLPSVMTCVNYLKMPDYSSLDVLKDKLHVAIKEGQGAFHLS